MESNKLLKLNLNNHYMILVIDASNIRGGGGLSHLSGILNFANPQTYGFKKVVVYSNIIILNSLPDKSWMVKETHPYLNKSFLWSFFFQIFLLSKHAVKKHHCSLLFVPGGSYLGNFRPFVTMSRNMLPFELKEAYRFKSKISRTRFLLLKLTQSRSFKKASGLIFLTSYAKKTITKQINLNSINTTIIPHGINLKFKQEPKNQRPLSTFSQEKPFELLYVSIITVYKHQWNVVKAVCDLYDNGYPIRLTLIGPVTKEGYSKLNKVLEEEKNSTRCISYLGSVDYEELSKYYKNSDGFVFASSCENMPNILIEAMAAGLPIASSNRGPMPEVLEDGGVYFDPESVDEIYSTLEEFISNEALRDEISQRSYKKTENYSWKDCSEMTFKYLSEIAKNKNHENKK